MQIANVLVRFYRAFNYDYLRKYHDRSSALPWEESDDGWYPFINLPLDRDITTIVGANESGKSQILTALKIALTGVGAERRDFCRYSRFFIVDGAMRLPDFGITLTELSEGEREALARICQIEVGEFPDSFTLIRGGDGVTRVWIRVSSDWKSTKLTAANLKTVNGLLPQPFEMHSDLPLPDLVPIDYLATRSAASSTSPGHSRAARQNVLSAVSRLGASVFHSTESVTAAASSIAAEMREASQPPVNASGPELELAAQLLHNIAGVGPEHFADLLKAIAEGRDGYVNGIQEQINKALASHLNFRKWWTQDSSFQLRVSVRESDLAFIIRDRTGTDYSFGERSSGLKYFLSYFVQYLAHEPPASGSEVLLMDEPDTFLSSQGQRDLLRIFDGLAHPEDDRPPCPVVYVTHSPFLMDKNHAERIRVLEKGEGEEGTRVVRDAAQNHYEPLRSAFGAFVAETTFMGSCNLMVEGPADQILLAGLSTWLQRKAVPSTERLDLNELTLVPASGASHIPYMVYLARGRDVEKPAVIVLLDGDTAGSDARKAIRRGGAYGKSLISEDLVIQLSDDAFEFTSPLTTSVIDIEDLVPIELAAAAAMRYATEFVLAGPAASAVVAGDIDARSGVLAGTQAAMRTALVDPDLTLDKVGFARHVLEVIAAPEKGSAPISEEALSLLESNFRSLFTVLGQMQRKAMAEHTNVKSSDRVARATAGFLDDHVARIVRSDVQVLFEQIGYSLDNTREAEEIRSEMRRLVDVHQLAVNSNSGVSDPDRLREDLAAISTLARQNSQLPTDETTG